MADALVELKRACKAAPRKSDTAAIETGSLTWFSGAPVAADAGLVALSQGADASVLIEEKSIVSVERDGGNYRVAVAADAHVMLRVEKVLKATPNGRCGCKDEKSPAARVNTGGVAGGLNDIEIGEIEVCDYICDYFYVAGLRFYVCVAVNCKKV